MAGQARLQLPQNVLSVATHELTAQPFTAGIKEAKLKTEGVYALIYFGEKRRERRMCVAFIQIPSHKWLGRIELLRRKNPAKNGTTPSRSFGILAITERIRVRSGQAPTRTQNKKPGGCRALCFSLRVTT